MTPRHLLSILCSVLLIATLPAAAEEARKEVELKWAKETATDFLDAGLQRNYASAETLATADFKKTLKEARTSSITFLLSTVVNQGAESWSIAREEIAPDMDEAVFRGAFRGKSGEATFTVRVVKEKDSGKWRVGFFAAGEFKDRRAE
jgi:hypothetical protein